MHASLRACTLAIYPAALAAALVAFAGPAAADDDVAARPSSGLAAEQLVAPERARAARDLEQELSDQLQALWATSPALHRGTTALYVADAVSGEVLFSVHEDRGLNPASNVKLVSTATALSVLGPDHRFRTRLYGAQPDAAGVIVGDLYLVGSHDMTFHRVDIENMATDLAAAGVTRVEGSVVLSDHATRDTLAQAGVKVTVTGTAHGRKPVVEVTPRTTMVDVDMDKLTTHKRARRRRARLRVSSQIQDTPTGPRLQLRLAGRIRPGKRAHYFRKVPRPSTFTGHVLHAALEDAGIEVVGGVTLADSAALAADPAIGVVELAAYESPTVRQLVARINKPSNNFLADRLIENVGAARYGGDPSMDKGVRAMKEFLSSVGIDPDQVVLDTGSGLSYRSSLSARQVAAVLRAAAGFSDIESLAAASHPIVASAGGSRPRLLRRGC